MILTQSHTLSFIKAYGLGNDFVIVNLDTLNHTWQQSLDRLSLILANRRYGVGCDQIMYYQRIDASDYRVRFFNNDGSEAEACGNGTRCTAKLIMQQEETSQVCLHTSTDKLICTRAGEQVGVRLHFSKLLQNLNFSGSYGTNAHYVEVGNPHLVCFTQNIQEANLAGPHLEYYLHTVDAQFPERVNVGFAKVEASDRIALSVWERAAGLTPACGTGACATAVIAYHLGLTGAAVVVEQRGGELDILVEDDSVLMKGEAVLVYEGYITL